MVRDLMNAGNWLEAIALIDGFTSQYELPVVELSKTLHLQGVCYRKLGHWEKAIEVHKMAYRINSHPSLLKELAMDWLEKGKRETGEEATRSLETALDYIQQTIDRSERDFPTALFLKGVVLRWLQRYEEAHRAIDQAIEKRERGKGDAYFEERARIFLKQGDRAKARAVLEEAIPIFLEEAYDAEPLFHLYRALLILLVTSKDLKAFRDVRDQAHHRGGLSWPLIGRIQRGGYSL